MSLQVDLLKKTERRYQGIVSMKVMVLGSVGVLVGTTVLVLSLAGISKATQNANLKRARREWDRVSPLAAVIRANGAAAETNRKTIERLDVWAKGGSAAMYKILRETQGEIPDMIQLRSLRAGILEDETDDQPSYYILRLSGRALGELVAVEARRKLNSNRDITGFCGDVRLISSEREAGDVWTFAMEGRRAQEDKVK
ncbi:hypothetical protein [Tichowtungia aerotolerans]|uniref:Uncharacterized protein n=1 Tax=Tichowtungia aerotolerans TaxID=2697043 RepID=A0A6P1M7Y9_9BACT|nr:hypothetical protein [Tichowtungia aerotolerans]QHI70829.1 hypothetical protein GT409_15730 [Tichowtungia aerotolerans]